jgi:hypothetical protein
MSDGVQILGGKRTGSILAHPRLHGDEANEQRAEENEQSNDLAAIPGICRSTPLASLVHSIAPSHDAETYLQRRDQAYDTRNEKQRAQGIQRPQLASQRLFAPLRIMIPRKMQENDNDDCGEATITLDEFEPRELDLPQGKVDPKTPPPGHLGGEQPSEQRASDGSESVHSTGHARILSTLTEGAGVGNNEQNAGEDASGADACDCPPADEGRRVGRQRAHQRPGFK